MRMLWGSQALALNEKSQSVGICPFVVTKKMLLPGEKIFMKNMAPHENLCSKKGA